MLISIQDVPLDERHLLFCSQLDHARRTRRHGRRVHNVPAINRSLTVCHGQVAADDRAPLAIGLNSEPVVRVPQPLGRFAAALECLSQRSASLAALYSR